MVVSGRRGSAPFPRRPPSRGPSEPSSRSVWPGPAGGTARSPRRRWEPALTDNARPRRCPQVKLKDGRVLTGTFHCLDSQSNLILTNGVRPGRSRPAGRVTDLHPPAPPASPLSVSPPIDADRGAPGRRHRAHHADVQHAHRPAGLAGELRRAGGGGGGGPGGAAGAVKAVERPDERLRRVPAVPRSGEGGGAAARRRNGDEGWAESIGEGEGPCRSCFGRTGTTSRLEAGGQLDQLVHALALYRLRPRQRWPRRTGRCPALGRGGGWREGERKTRARRGDGGGFISWPAPAATFGSA